jgi:hypothetical protein
MTKLSVESLGPAGQKLRNVLPAAEVEALLGEAASVLDHLEGPQGRYRFGAFLARKERAVLRVLGRCIMAQAILHGARGEDDDSPPPT